MKALLIADDGQVEVAAAVCIGQGLGIEVQAFYDPDLLARDPQAIARHRQIIAPIGLCALHGPFGDLCPGSFDAMVREVARNRFELGYRVARQLGATDIVLHHGYVPGTSSPAGWLRRSSAFWKDFLADKTPDVTFHLENLLERDPQLLGEVLAAVDDPRLDACLDVGHVHCHSPLPAARWIERLGERIGYVHLHDNHGAEDEHLGLGDGTMPLDEVCAALEAYAPGALWTMEMLAARVESSLRWLREHELWPQ